MDTMQGKKRTHYCGELRGSDVGKQVTVAGFVAKRRDKGSLVFVDLRDRTGIVQMTFDEHTPSEVMEKAHTLRAEYVVMATAEVKRREAVNPDLPTGEIELAVSDLRLLSRAQTPPIQVSDKANVGEEARLTYRYLDLRRPALQKNLKMRHDIARVAREYFYENGFYEIETPMLMKSTPEGARDYLVPSRVHAGCFYALPQSPQIYKQLLMLAGYDRYIQLARCFRDEDLRADRQPEFTQIDLEMSFVTAEDVMEMIEGFVMRLMKEVKGITLSAPLPRLTYAKAMERFGSDKPDTRFGMELCNLDGLAKECGFPLFADTVQNGGTVRGIVAKGAAGELTRKKIDKLTEFVRGIGAKGLAYIRYAEETPNCSFGKFLKEGELAAFCEALGCEQGDVAFLIADQPQTTLPVLGALRLQLGKQLDLIPDGYDFLWITEFPFFEWDTDSKSWVAMHHPFTMPLTECLPDLHTHPERVRAQAYDLVLNGVELCSGSIRITDPDLQQQMFEALGMSEEEIAAKFGFLVEAYRYGAPPHGGAGIGLDRLAMILCGAESLRDVVAFPKVQNAGELMSGSPAPVDDTQLQELHISLTEVSE